MMYHVKYYLFKEIKTGGSFNTHSEKSSVYSFDLGDFFKKLGLPKKFFCSYHLFSSSQPMPQVNFFFFLFGGGIPQDYL